MRWKYDRLCETAIRIHSPILFQRLILSRRFQEGRIHILWRGQNIRRGYYWGKLISYFRQRIFSVLLFLSSMVLNIIIRIIIYVYRVHILYYNSIIIYINAIVIFYNFI